MWKKYISATPENVARIMLGLKGVLLPLSITEMATGNAKVAFYILLALGFLDEGAKFLTRKKSENETKDDTSSDK